MPRQITRRAVLHAAAVGLTGCGVRLGGPGESRLRLTARPSPAMARSLPTGTWTIRLDNGRVGLVHVPARDVRALVVALHGARGTARSGLDLLRAQADRLAFVILAPASAGSTWAVLRGGADPDTPALDAALTEVLAAQPLDTGRLAVAGFSDGASYALSLGLANGDLFSRVVAFSPGFQAAGGHRRGRPELFITHGTRDRVLPIERTSRPLVHALTRDGYAVTYREFDGPHTVPPALAAEAADWILH